jgi:hypothetical protein
VGQAVLSGTEKALKKRGLEVVAKGSFQRGTTAVKTGLAAVMPGSVAEAAATSSQMTNVILVDTVDDIPPGTPAGTLIVAAARPLGAADRRRAAARCRLGAGARSSAYGAGSTPARVTAGDAAY